MAELSSQQTSVQSIYSWYSQDKLFVNRRYQRKLVWTLLEKQKLVESIIKKYPVPAILIAEREDDPGTYEIIDGLQRLHAIVSFIETSFPTVTGTYFDVDQFPTAKSRAAEGHFIPENGKAFLTAREIGTLLDYPLAISVMRNATEDEVNDVFDRINTYGHRLSEQERRQAGVQNTFSNLVREISCSLRGDASSDIMKLSQMPAISIDLPMTKHGYEVRAEEVFWVNQGILRATDLRDSMDEQCIADVLACVVKGDMIPRSKDALDEIYQSGSAGSETILAALEVYGAENASDELKFCVDEILQVCAATKDEKLRDIIFSRRNTNAFPAVFATILIAFHELIVGGKNKISDYAGIKKALTGLSERVVTGQRSTSIEERRKTINTIKGLIADYFVPADVRPAIYGNHSTIDIDATIRRSEIELSHYELKQGMLNLSDRRDIDGDIIDKVVRTICAIANNGPERHGEIIIGVTDKDADADRIHKLDGIIPRKVGRRFVVGVDREAKALGITVEQYYSRWKDGIKKSELSEHLKASVLSSIDYNSFYGLGVIAISIPPQSELSFVGEELYWRNGDTTQLAKDPKTIAAVARRF